MEEDLGQTELDTFKILSNADMVDWSRRAPEFRKPPTENEWGGDFEEPEREAEIVKTLTQQVRAVQASSERQFGNQSPLETPYKLRESGYRRSASNSPPLPRSRSPTPPPKNLSNFPEPEVFVKMEPLQRELQEEEFFDARDSKGRAHGADGYSSRGERNSSRERPSEFGAKEVTPPQGSMPKRVMPQPKKYTAAEENDDYEIKAEKEGLLHEIHTFSRPPHSIKMTREWDIAVHTLDELQYEVDRINSELSANGIVDMAKSGIKFGVSGLEMFLKQQGIDSVDGWYNNSCKDMSKFNRPLLRLYKKYWRNTNLSPMMELGYLLMGGLVWTIAENKMGFKKSSSSSSSTSGTASYDAAPSDKPSTAKMRPPSNSSFAMPKWGAENNSAPIPPTNTSTVTPQPPDAERPPVTIVAPPPIPSGPTEIEKQLMAKQKETEAALQKMSSENALMIQMLQNLAKTQVSTPKHSPRSSAKDSPREIRLPMGKRSVKKTPKVNLVQKEGNEDALSL
jgi:hypothetical protein